jgi:hypothetical protein
MIAEQPGVRLYYSGGTFFIMIQKEVE